MYFRTPWGNRYIETTTNVHPTILRGPELSHFVQFLDGFQRRSSTLNRSATIIEKQEDEVGNEMEEVERDPTWEDVEAALKDCHLEMLRGSYRRLRILMNGRALILTNLRTAYPFRFFHTQEASGQKHANCL